MTSVHPPPSTFPMMPGQEKPFMMTAFVNMAPKLATDRDVKLILAMLIYQHTMQYCPIWGKASSGLYYAGQGQAAADSVPKNHDLHLILETPDQPDAAGYHEQVGGQSISKSFLAPELANGGTILGDPSNPTAPAFAPVVGHEFIEADADRETNDYRDGPPIAQGSSYALEPGDPVENDSYPISVADPDDASKTVIVMATNFVTPRWFNPQLSGLTTPDGTPIIYDVMGRLSNPFAMTAGGYMIVRAGGPGTEQQVFAHKSGVPTTDPSGYPTPWRLAHRLTHPESRLNLRKQAALISLGKGTTP